MKVTEHVEHLLRQGKKPNELVELGFPRQVVTRVRRRLREVTSGRIGGRDLEKLIEPRKSSRTGDGMTQETPETVNVREANISLLQRLDNLEKTAYNLAATYAFNEAAKEREQTTRRAPPCPECSKRSDRGFIRSIKREMTHKDRRELIECMKEARLGEEDIEVLLEQEPTHIIEARCHQSGYEEFIGYAEE